jgi:membrane protein CcdC involved in cytochrome C biogenesis
MTPQQYGPLIGVAVALVLIVLRNQRPRTLKPQWMWVAPLLVVTAIGFGIWGMSHAPGMPHTPFGVSGWVILAVGLALGSLAGWWRGKTVTIEKEPDGSLKAQASPIGIVLVVLLLVSRQAIRPWLEAHAAGWHVNALAIQDAFLLFAVGLVVLQRVEMYLRARRVLAGGTDAHVEVAA